MRLPKSTASSSSNSYVVQQFVKSSLENGEEDEEDGEYSPIKKQKKNSHKSNKCLSTILSKAPPAFPWLFSSTANDVDEKTAKMEQNQSPSTSAFQLFEKNCPLTKNITADAPPIHNSDTNEIAQNTIKSTESEQQKRQFGVLTNEAHQTGRIVEKESDENAPVGSLSSFAEELEAITSSEIPIPEKALSGGTLFQRATQMAKVDGQAYENEDGLEGGRSAGGGGGTFSSFSLAPLKKTSLLTATLLEGNARLGIMTEAHREAAVSEWRRKSQKELMRKQKQGGEDEGREEEGISLEPNGEEAEEEFLDLDEQFAKEILADVDKEELEARARRKAKKAVKRLRKEKEKQQKSDRTDEKHPEQKLEEPGKRRTRKGEEKVGEASSELKRKKQRRKADKSGKTGKKRRKKSRSRSRSRTRSHSPTGRAHRRSCQKSRPSSSRTYSSISPPARSRTRSHSPLPAFSRRRAMETRRRLIEESWHRRIEHSIRPLGGQSLPRKKASSPRSREKPLERADYTDEHGQIDKQKLLDIATRNATKLAMEGKLPKGAELIETIKNKSVEQLVGLCKKLQTEKNLLPGGSSSDEDGERRYSREYEDWHERRHRSKDRQFRNRGVRPADHPSRQKLQDRDRRELRLREENHLRLTFPVSSGVQHRTKANEPLPQGPAGPLVLRRGGDIGPLTTALAKIRTSIPSSYRPLAQPLASAQPSSVLSTHFRATCPLALGPQVPEEEDGKKPLPGIVRSKAYEIALAALERTAELEKEKTKEPMMASSSEFIGPQVPRPTAMEVMAGTTTSAGPVTPEGQKPASAFPPLPPPVWPTDKRVEEAVPAVVSSWDKPGHIAAREAFLKRIADQRRQAEEAAAAVAAEAKAKVDKAQIEAAQMEVGQLQQGTAGQACPDARDPSKESAQAKVQVQLPVPTNSQNAREAAPLARAETLENAQAAKAIAAMAAVKGLPKKGDFALPFASAPVRLLLPTSSFPTSTEEEEGQGGDNLELVDKVHAYVEAQVARQKAESTLHATILSAQLHQQQQGAHSSSKVPRNELSSFGSSSKSKDPIGLTKTPKSIQDLVAERLRFGNRLQRDPNDFEARKALASVEEEMSKWARDSTLPGEFTGHTGARVLSEKELEPTDPRFHAWAKKDQFRNAPEVSSGVGVRLMERMGWKPGQGLGKDAAGPVEPLALDVKSDKRGFYSEDLERMPRRESVLDPTGKNPISILMEVCSRERWQLPEFYCVETGPHNNRRYHWKAVLNGVEYSPSLPSSNKRAGKAQVCMVVLEALGLTA